MNEIAPVLPLLEAMALRYQPVDERCVRLGFTGRHINYDVLIIAGGPLLSVVATAESRISAARLDEVIRLANLLNATRVPWGAFWVHPARRHLGFELALPTAGGVSLEALGLALSAIALNVFWPMFARVLWAGLPAAAAIAAAAANDDEERAAADEDDDDDDPEVTF